MLNPPGGASLKRRAVLKSMGVIPALLLLPPVVGGCEGNKGPGKDSNTGNATFDVKDAGAMADATIADASIDAGSRRLILATDRFTSADVGKSVVIRGAGDPRTLLGASIAIAAGATTLTSVGTSNFRSRDVRSTITVAGAGKDGAALSATIVKVISASVIELDTPAATTVNGAAATVHPYLTCDIDSVVAGVANLSATAGTSVAHTPILYGTDDTDAINHAVNSAADAGGGQVVLPAGNYLTAEPISLDRAHHLTIRGGGNGASVIYRIGIGGSAIFHTLKMTKDAPLTEFTLANLTVDGTYMQGKYDVHNCGVRAKFLSHCTFRDLTIQHTLATGLGTDFLTGGTTITNVQAHQCGAGSLGGSSGGGCAGIGIGTGQYDTEDFAVTGCRADGNGTYGIFIETETGTCSKGMKISDCSAEGNGIAGFCDAGGDGALWTNCVSKNNLIDGFQNSAGTVLEAKPGQNTMWSKCTATGNAANGFRYSPQVLGTSPLPPQPNDVCDVTWTGCSADANGQSGWRLESAPDLAFDGVIVKDCEASGNGGSGVSFVGPGGFQNVKVDGGSYRGNGHSAEDDRYGIRVDCRVVADMTITGVKASGDDGAPQNYGLAVGPTTTINNLTVDSNDLRGNVIGPISKLGTITGTVVTTNNDGYAP